MACLHLHYKHYKGVGRDVIQREPPQRDKRGLRTRIVTPRDNKTSLLHIWQLVEIGVKKVKKVKKRVQHPTEAKVFSSFAKNPPNKWQTYLRNRTLNTLPQVGNTKPSAIHSLPQALRINHFNVPCSFL